MTALVPFNLDRTHKKTQQNADYEYIYYKVNEPIVA